MLLHHVVLPRTTPKTPARWLKTSNAYCLGGPGPCDSCPLAIAAALRFDTQDDTTSAGPLYSVSVRDFQIEPSVAGGDAEPLYSALGALGALDTCETAGQQLLSLGFGLATFPSHWCSLKAVTFQRRRPTLNLDLWRREWCHPIKMSEVAPQVAMPANQSRISGGSFRECCSNCCAASSSEDDRENIGCS